MVRNVKVAATQMSCSNDEQSNIDRALTLIRKAHAEGAQIILIQELFSSLYFCQDQAEPHFGLASTFEDSKAVKAFQAIAKELSVVVPCSFFERRGNAHYNSVAMIDADGSVLGIYRKTHIPDGPGYQEKFYFTPGDTGFKVWKTKYATVGVAICWDQWFPECARAMALQGAEVLFYPTAIGSEPQNPKVHSKGHWQRTQQGHAAANLMPVIASNRVGTEKASFISSEITFYGGSFIADNTGKFVAEANETDDMIVLTAEFDLDALAMQRYSWGLFRDRRPEHYSVLMTSDGDASFATRR